MSRQLFINTFTLLMMLVVVLQISAPYSRTGLTDSCFELHVFFNCRNAALALPILAFTSTPDLPCSLMKVSCRYVKVSTSSTVSPSSMIELVFSVMYLRTLVFPLCMLRRTD
ncbi:unnamed protein product [Schistosoma margrebowiei]|uniref:Uncharacterized protein n=1 Tax=Schistosoma margrebowiei TaxID=48269 RepID=A0A183MZC4_9TREM|nr:unnamed protein product [Schistosoma margrebowiei]